jgi:hypothetical protein
MFAIVFQNGPVGPKGPDGSEGPLGSKCGQTQICEE